MRFVPIAAVILVTCLALLLSPSVQSRSANSPDQRNSRDHNLTSHVQTALDQVLGDSWPQYYGMQKTGMINASFTCFGQIGLGFYHGVQYSEAADFETPPGSGVEYLYGGALWIGGIVGQDTLVSVGADGWQTANDLRPTSSAGTVYRYPFISNYSMVAEYSDTMTNPAIDLLDRRPHRPLGVKVVNRSHSYASSPANNCVFYDLAITNIGLNNIREGYIGWYVDADVGSTSELTSYSDDITGTLVSDSIAYIIDDDGDYDGGFSCPKTIAFKYLSSSFVPAKTSFNWWVSSSQPTLDFGPQTRVKYRDLQTGGTGTPEGDRNKYAYLSNGEWDYDQVMTATIDSTDPIWMYPYQPSVVSLSRGYDTRFLYSIGPFDLAPGATVYVQYVTFTGDSVHLDSLNFQDHLLSAYEPQAYLANLNFSNLLRNASVADSLAPLLMDALGPPTGLRVAESTPTDLTLVWDSVFNQGIDGYNIYATTVPDSLFEYQGILPPWLASWQPESPVLYRQIDSTSSVTLDSLSPCTWYAFNVAARKGSGVGPLGFPSVLSRLETETRPVVSDSALFTAHDLPTTLVWSPGSFAAYSYNIYKFADKTAAKFAFTPHYRTDSVWVYGTYPDELIAYPSDTIDWQGVRYYYYSLEPYAHVPGDHHSWVDPDWHLSNLYRITAVDSCGFESEFSLVIRSLDATRIKDVLIMYQVNPFIHKDSIEQEFRNMLGDGISYDLVPWYGAEVDVSSLMSYRNVILDATINEGIGVEVLPGVQPYLASGGKIVYCGSLRDPSLSIDLSDPLPASNATPYPSIREVFDVDSIRAINPSYYYYLQPPSHTDSLFGFRGADPGEEVVVSPLNYDTTTVIPAHWYGFYETKTAAAVATFVVNDSSHDRVIYRFRSLWGDQSFCHGKPVGVLTRGDNWETYLLGFHLWMIETDGASQLVRWIVDRVPTDVSEPSSARLPASCWLGQNFPNPFNPTTSIRFALPRNSHVTVEVFNILGQRVATLADCRMNAGEHTITWDGRTNQDQGVASGIYLYRLRADNAVLVKKMVLLK